MSKKEIPCEIYSRVVGYFRPVKHWNKGKTEEFGERVTCSIKKIKRSIKNENRL